MAAVVTLGDLAARARRHAKQENSEFVTDDELYRLLLTGVQTLRDRLHQRGQEYERTTLELQTIPGQWVYELPEDYYRLQLLMANRGLAPLPPGRALDPPEPGTWFGPASDSDGWLLCHPFELVELPALLNVTNPSPGQVRYRLRGRQASGSEAYSTPVRQIEIRPTPREAFTLRIEFLPATKLPLNNKADFPIEGLNGFEEIPVLQAAIFMVGEEEGDTGRLERFLLREETRLDEVAPAQDVARPERIVDIYDASCSDDLYARRGYGP